MRSRHLKNTLGAVALVVCGGCGGAEPAVQLADINVARGERADFQLEVPAGKQDPATFIPLTVIAGEREGPTVLMVAGVHGYEFPPILAADRLAREITPEMLSGTLIIVRVAHISAYEDRAPYVNPFDRKNLNRSFPGSADGTQAERIAHLLSTAVIPAADFVFDVHGGDGAEWLEAFIGVYGGPLATNYEQALGVAQSMGFPNIVRYKMNTQQQVDQRRSLNRQAVAQGLPTVLVEAGQNGSRDDVHVDLIVSGMRNALTYLGLLQGPESQAAVTPRYFDGTQSVPVTHSGLWYPTRRAGKVEAGERLGEIRDYRGDTVETVTAPASGYGIYGLAGPPVRAGDSVMTIAQPIDSFEE
ncbi:MAG: succinylglutamate desuccinylase/aspartoacylase family protein [Pseudomonadota bacterium]